MTPSIEGFVTRADAGLRPPESVSRNVDPSRGGSTIHYGGGAQRIRFHLACVGRWHDWQDLHVDTRGWADIAYTGGACDHGYAFAGRGLGIRTAANGTADGNDRHYAFVWIGGAGETPTVLALRALDWWIVTARNAGAGLEVVPHSRWKPTACPGDPLRVYAASRHLVRSATMPGTHGPDPDTRAMRDAHSLPGIPSWSPWAEYVDEGGTTVPESGVWPAYRADLAWYAYNGPLADRVAALERRVADLESRPVSGGLTRTEADGLYVPRGYRLE